MLMNIPLSNELHFLATSLTLPSHQSHTPTLPFIFSLRYKHYTCGKQPSPGNNSNDARV